MYSKFIRPILFKFDPEDMHNLFLNVGKNIGKVDFARNIVKQIYYYENHKLNTNVLNLRFNNPVGLAAGFDKDASLINVMPNVGFGFNEVGSITGKPCPGNKEKRLLRLPKDNAIVVNYGLKSIGAKAVANKLKHIKSQIPLGINIARANNPNIINDINTGIKDYLFAYKTLNRYADYITINISCPNTPEKYKFTDINNFKLLLKALNKENIKKSCLIKMKADLQNNEINEFISLTSKYDFVKGFIISNLTKDRTNLQMKDFSYQCNGSISGKPLSDKSNKLIYEFYKQMPDDYIIIGCGGIFNANDAYVKIKNGASLVQLITSMIYEGPSVVKDINKGLVELMQNDGFDKISDVVGQNH